jgi:hypothetical protein
MMWYGSVWCTDSISFLSSNISFPNPIPDPIGSSHLYIMHKCMFFCVLHSLPCSGPQYKIDIGGQECTVEKLLEELYQKAAIANLWSLVRHTSGMLRKSIENLGAVSQQERE